MVKSWKDRGCFGALSLGGRGVTLICTVLIFLFCMSIQQFDNLCLMLVGFVSVYNLLSSAPLYQHKLAP